ncbi:MAG: UDP-N-acetylmuramate--L-alanine ligase [Oligoflexia bacterium]|nr:UDP-N-acetylmuramate--L-alanine ligase [Oligoflexia bacterium]MBF0364801.1 UDP-N-acetylmuramate--L-alanine ligase [Oligoflexia bacterium]
MFNSNIQSKLIKVHFIGIGGIGMSGIAEILLRLNYSVSGSDLSVNQNILKLRELGAEIKLGHAAENVDHPTVVVYSSAVDLKNNPEVLEAKRKSIPLIKRAEMLSELMRLKYGIAIAGSHGKTTTTSFLATILFEAGMDATHIIGGIVENLGGHARVGQGDILVAEADESDGSFLLLGPIISVITNIDDDHLDFYKTKRNLVHSFLKFANRVPFYGHCILNIHDEEIKRIRNRIKRPWLTFGIEDQALKEIPNYQAKNVIYGDGHTEYDLYFEGKKATEIKIFTSGVHNVLNSLGAIAVAHQLGLEFLVIASSLVKFKGVGRRLELLFKTGPLEIIDDYGHHPTEIANAIQTVRKVKASAKIVVIFEPHRYTRTMLCWEKFLHCFNDADEVYVLPIYAASEKPLPGISSIKLVEDINKIHPQMAKYLPSFAEFPQVFSEHAILENTVFLSLGAGSIGKNMREFIKGRL